MVIGGTRASELAGRFGTPLVVYCEQTLRARGPGPTGAAGEDGRVFYGTKAFPNVALLRLLREEGIGADVASAGELAFARAAGLSGDELVVHGNNKDAAFLEEAGKERASLSWTRPTRAELAIAAGVEHVLVRVTLGVDADTHEAIVTGHHGSKFGLPPAQARALVADALGRGLDVLGLHVHVGSQLPDFTAQEETIRRLAEFASESRDALGWEARIVDLGGGFGIRHHPEEDVPEAAALATAAAATAREAFVTAGLPRPAVWLEPGRCLVGRAGVTLYRVGAVKRLDDRAWVAVDGGMSDNLAPSSTVRATRRSARSGRTRSRTRRSASPACTASRATCSSTTSRFPHRVEETCSRCCDGRVHAGDELELQRRPAPRRNFARDGEARVIRSRESLDDLPGAGGLERIPSGRRAPWTRRGGATSRASLTGGLSGSAAAQLRKRPDRSSDGSPRVVR